MFKLRNKNETPCWEMSAGVTEMLHCNSVLHFISDAVVTAPAEQRFRRMHVMIFFFFCAEVALSVCLQVFSDFGDSPS